jgi:hypothetical protein
MKRPRREPALPAPPVPAAPPSGHRAPSPGELLRAAERPPGSDGELIARVRRHLGASAKGLSEMLGIDTRTITRWESNQSPSPATAWMAIVLLLCMRLDRSLDRLVRGSDGDWKTLVERLMAMVDAAASDRIGD